MCQEEFYEELSSATGEDVKRISQMGFVPLTNHPYEIEERRVPLMIDWDLMQFARS